MAKNTFHKIDTQIDQLTNSIQNTVSGDSFETEVLELSKTDLVNLTKANGWKFDWKFEFRQTDRKTYKLTIQGNPNIVQGLVSISEKDDHFYLHLIENAPFNFGRKKIYEGVPGNLFAFTCKLSLEKGHEGFVSFHSKTILIEHYENMLGAIHVGGHKMIIFPDAAQKLIHHYFKNF